jgi:hypothetical protein
LFSARHPMGGLQGGASQHGGYSQAQWGYGAGPGGGPAAPIGSGESPLRRALELAREIATHPLTFIVYALIAAYALIWTLLAGRSKRPLAVASTSNHESRHHSRSGAHRSPAAPEPVSATKVRKRVRVRMRVRKHHHSR